jgi:hypothetical protein
VQEYILAAVIRRDEPVPARVVELQNPPCSQCRPTSSPVPPAFSLVLAAAAQDPDPRPLRAILRRRITPGILVFCPLSDLLDGGSVTRHTPDQPEDQPLEEFHRDRRDHPGKLARYDDDQLARLTEEERVEAGLDAYDPDEVPPATDEPPTPDITQSDVYQEARAEIEHELDEDELRVRGERDPFPPTRYDRS